MSLKSPTQKKSALERRGEQSRKNLEAKKASMPVVVPSSQESRVNSSQETFLRNVKKSHVVPSDQISGGGPNDPEKESVPISASFGKAAGNFGGAETVIFTERSKKQLLNEANPDFED